jgi:homopolymeric O-antigen transport system permease protein
MESPDRELVLRPDSPWSLRQVRDIWDSRELLWILALRDVSVRYKQAFLGVAWAILQPVTQMVVFTVLFNRFAGIDSGSELPYPLFCFSGLVAWTLFSSGLSHASESLVASSNLVTKVYFPRAVLPLASIGAALVDFSITFVLVFPLAWWLGVPIHWTLVLAPFIALLGAACAVAIGLWTSAINLQYRDIRYALPFFLQLLIFITPVFYPASRVPEKWRALLALNPMAAVVEAFRASLFGGPLPWARLGLACVMVLVVGALGFLRFRQLERTFADRV